MKLLEQCRQTARVKHFSWETEKTYLHWIERFIRFHGIRHPAEMGASEVEAFLTHLAVHGRVAASTQNQALSALLFLYREVLRLELGTLDAVRANRPKRIPAVLSVAKVARLLAAVDALPTTEPYGLMARLMYGAGLRLMECCRLRMKDVDLERGQLTIREGKGNKDRYVMLPAAARGGLERLLAWRRTLHERDLSSRSGSRRNAKRFGGEVSRCRSLAIVAVRICVDTIIARSAERQNRPAPCI